MVLVLLVLMHLALCSRRLLTHGMEKYAQSMLRPPSGFFLGNLDNISMSPLYFADIFSSPNVTPVDFLGALDDEEFFVVEGSGGGVAGSLDSQVTCHQHRHHKCDHTHC